jgi:hypothetical protein
MGNAPPARPTPHARPEGIHDEIAEIESPSCIGLHARVLLAVAGKLVAWVHSLLIGSGRVQGASRAPMAADPPGVAILS